MLTQFSGIGSIDSLQFQPGRTRIGARPPLRAPGQVGPARSVVSERTEEEQMGDLIRRRFNRREAMKVSVLGAGALTVSAAGGGRFLINHAGAQDATPAPTEFDRAACYNSFPNATPVKYDKVGDPPYSLALSNSYIGNVWRTQMINMANVFVKRPDIAPLVKDFQVASSGEDVAAQIAQTENMVSAGAQAIIINAINPDALVPTVNKARQQGIVVVAFDNIVNSDEIVFVNEDQYEMGKKWAEWLVDQVGGKGKILMVTGVQGTSVDTDRTKGGDDVFSQHPDIQTVKVVGKWDPGVAQTVTANALAANKDFVGVWCQGGTDGVVRAFQAAGLPLVPVAGEAENGFRKQMLEYKDQFKGYSIGQSPGLVAVSIRVALDLLQGNEVPSAISVPLPEAKTEDLVPGVNVFPDAPDNFFTPVNIDACGVSFTYDEIAPKS
jgi:ribose transport system substrate-binding protein